MIVYRITNSQNGKVYIGLTTKGLDTRWRWHVRDSRRAQTPLHRAIRKYGPTAFRVEEIACALSGRDLKALERTLIAQHNSRVDVGHGYNCTDGGDGVLNPTARDRAARSARMKAQRLSPGFLERSNAAKRGKPQPPHVREALQAAARRKRSPEWIEKIAALRRGSEPSMATRAKMSAAQKRRFSDPEVRAAHAAARKGQRRSPEAAMQSAVSRRRNLIAAKLLVHFFGVKFDAGVPEVLPFKPICGQMFLEVQA